MNINVDKLKGSLRELNKIIEEYESTYYNLYNELSSCSMFWQDNNSILFFEDVNKEKLAVKETIEEFKSIAELYDYLVNKYGEYGRKIKFDLKFRDDIISKIDNYLSDIYDILDDFRNLDFRFYSAITNNIYGDMDKIMDIANILVGLKSSIKKRFNAFEEIEKEITLRVSKINIDILKVSDISAFI